MRITAKPNKVIIKKLQFRQRKKSLLIYGGRLDLRLSFVEEYFWLRRKVNTFDLRFIFPCDFLWIFCDVFVVFFMPFIWPLSVTFWWIFSCDVWPQGYICDFIVIFIECFCIVNKNLSYIGGCEFSVSLLRFVIRCLTIKNNNRKCL